MIDFFSGQIANRANSLQEGEKNAFEGGDATRNDVLFKICNPLMGVRQ